jgi:negative regulator of sigma E activity
MSRFDDELPDPLQDRLNAELRNALRREEPPLGFEARLMARLSSESERETGLARWFKLPLLRFPMMTRLAFTAVVCLMVVAGVQYERERQERIDGEAAKAKLMQALRVTGTQLQAVRGRVMDSSGERSAGE